MTHFTVTLPGRATSSGKRSPPPQHGSRRCRQRGHAAVKATKAEFKGEQAHGFKLTQASTTSK